MLNFLSYRRHLQLTLWLLGAMVCLPFLNPHHYNPIPSFYAEWWAASLGLLGCTLFLRKEAQTDLRLPVITLLPLALIVLFLFQLLAGKIFIVHQGLLFSLYLLWACLMALLGRVLQREVGLSKLADALAIGILAGGLVSLTIVVMQFQHVHLGLEFLFPGKEQQVFGNLGQRNQFADYLWLGIISAAYLRQRSYLSPRLFLLTALPLAACAILTASRTVYLYIFAIGLMTWAMAHKNEGLQPLWRSLRWIIFLSLAIEGTKHFLAVTDLPLQTAGDRLYQDGGSANIRLLLWQIAWKSFCSAPLLGVGLGQFPWQTFLLGGQIAPGALPGAAEHAHNIILQLLAEFGLGSLLTILALGLALWRELRRATWEPACWWGCSAVLIVGIHSMLEYPLWYAFFLGPVALILGALAPAPLSIRLEKLGAWGLTLVILTSAWILGNLYRDYSLLENTFYWRNLSAVERSPWPEVHHKLGLLHQDSLFPHYIELFYSFATPIGRDNLEEKLLIIENSLRFSPVDRLVFKYSALLALAGRQIEAEAMLHQAILTYPDKVSIAYKQFKELAKTQPEIQNLLPLLEKAPSTASKPGSVEKDAPAGPITVSADPQTPPSLRSKSR